ncbi:MAG: RNA polymerase primary sigma factor [Rhodothermales bacterium]|jgi:RNA polymerase primary sigma factor
MYHQSDPMKAYMQEISQVPLITREEEVELAAQIRGGSEEAKHKLVKANLRLVVKIAHDFKGLGLPLLDLISEGNIGLMRAAEKFDPLKGAKFSSYSAWWIKQSMRRALSQKSRTIRVPVASAGKINKIRTAKIDLADLLGRPPTDTEIAEHLDLTKRTVQGLNLADLRTFSIHDPIQKGENGSFEDIIPDSDSPTPDVIIQDNECLERLRTLLHHLDERERTILTFRYGLEGNRPKTLEEVSSIIGRTRERVRQIQMHALKKLRCLLEDEDDLKEAYARAENEKLNGKADDGVIGISLAIRTCGRAAKSMGYNHPELFDNKSEVSVLNFSTRVRNGLRSAGITTIAQLASATQDELMTIRSFGAKCLFEVRDALNVYARDLANES